jgi:integrase
MPTVYQRRRSDGTKAKIFTADIWINGQKFPRSTGKQTRREAEKEATRIEQQLRAELSRKHEPLTLDTLMGRYWTDHAADLPSGSDVKYHIARILEILDKNKPLAELSNADVAYYVTTRKKQLTRTWGRGKEPRTDTGLKPGQATQQGFYTRRNGVRVRVPKRELIEFFTRERKAPKPVSAATINRELDVLQAAYMRARDSWEHPVRPINWGDHRLEKPGKRNRTLSVDEARRAIALARTRSVDMADAIELSYYTGMRQNELETLVAARVNLAERYAVVLAKRKARQEYRERLVWLNTAAVALLAERIKPDTDPQAPLFVLTNARKLWEWVKFSIGRPDTRWHDLRHATGSMIADQTKDPLMVQRQLGHTSINTSMGYIHVRDERVLEAVETIPALTERRVTRLLPAPVPSAENQAEPPSSATTTHSAADKSASE